MRVAIVVAVACLSAAGLCAGQDAQASIKKSTDIPAQELVPALKTLAHERGFHVVFLAELVGNRRTQGAMGDLTTAEALTRLLEGTNLVYSYLDDKTVTIIPVNSNNKLDGQGPSAGNLHRCSGPSSDKLDYPTSLNQSASGSTAINWTAAEGASDCVEVYSQENQRLASAVAGADAAPIQDSGGESNLNRGSTGKEDLTEIVVTARKVTERLEDVPIALTVINADSMTEKGQVRLEDYYSTVPGLSLIGGGRGAQVGLMIRGVGSVGGFSSPSVAVTVDDVPIGASSTAILNGANFVPQLDPADLQRIEFLKGPQGTLYGASALGGVMRYVTATPNLGALSGRVEVDGNSVAHGGAGYGVRGSLNLPLVTDLLGLRVSGFRRRDPGFIDNSSRGLSRVNTTDLAGGHAALLFQPNPDFSVQLSALIQWDKTLGSGDVNTDYLYHPLIGDLVQNQMPVPPRLDQVQLYAATLSYHSKWFDVTSVTGYSLSRNDYVGDISDKPFLVSIAQSVFPTATGASFPNYLYASKLTEELRLSSKLDKLEWQVGEFYTDENNSPNHSLFTANDVANGAVIGDLFDGHYRARYFEVAEFANLTYHFTDRFSVQGGGREAHSWQTFDSDFAAPTSSRANHFTYLFSPQYRVSDSTMTYARIASGYITGAPNTPTVPDPRVPPTFDPSTTVNYEVGLKGRWFEQRLALDAALFYIDYSKIQLAAASNGLSFIYSGGKAKSQGLELALDFKPVQNLSLRATVAYTDAELTEGAGADLPGKPGDPLPLSGKYSASVSAEQRFRLTSAIGAFVSATAAFVDRRYEPYAFNGPSTNFQASIPSYTYGNIELGASEGGYTVTAYVRNVTNERGVLSTEQQNGATVTSGVWYTSFITPRTLGLTIARSF